MGLTVYVIYGNPCNGILCNPYTNVMDLYLL